MTHSTHTGPAHQPGKWLLLLAGLLLAGLLLAADCLGAVFYPNAAVAAADKKADWYRQCLRVKADKAPLRDLPRSTDPARCNAADLYYDTRNMDTPADSDWQRVRDCAFRTNAGEVLMMLYANGTGVMPNLNLATKYACTLDSSAAEMKSRVAHLQRRARGLDGGDFDLCDDVSTGSMHGYCAAVRERQHDKQRAEQLAAVVKTWTGQEQSAFDMVNKAARYFAQHRADYETDLSANSKRVLQLEASAAELDQFNKDIRDFEGGKLPQYSEANFRVLDDKMNEVYRNFLATPVTQVSYLGTIRKTGVEKTQHAWLAYRDAMELFVSMKYPSMSASALRTMLTSRRLRQLVELENAAAGR
jgi:uncharacterized protein YecT (DUF1311 family)